MTLDSVMPIPGFEPSIMDTGSLQVSVSSADYRSPGLYFPTITSSGITTPTPENMTLRPNEDVSMQYAPGLHLQSSNLNASHIPQFSKSFPPTAPPTSDKGFNISPRPLRGLVSPISSYRDWEHTNGHTVKPHRQISPFDRGQREMGMTPTSEQHRPRALDLQFNLDWEAIWHEYKETAGDLADLVPDSSPFSRAAIAARAQAKSGMSGSPPSSNVGLGNNPYGAIGSHLGIGMPHALA